jgi:hypothetical protein
VFADKIEGVVVRDDYDVEAFLPVLFRERFIQFLKVAFTMVSLRVHILIIELDTLALAFALQDRLDAGYNVVGPAQTLVIGVENKNVLLGGGRGLAGVQDKDGNYDRRKEQER